ncbi:hypothetical protein IMZ48_28090 [Candidatus Bathyarchaeota archaeon]|nr:hypothetical protein [Candidatus Bathyarchaeota archaeon]
MNKLGQWVLKRCLSREIRDAVMGDIDEMAAVMTREEDASRAKVCFWRHLIRSLPFLLAEKLQRKWSRLHGGMTWPGLEPKNGVRTSLLPIAGLSIGLACCLTILAITRDLRPEARVVGRGEGKSVAATSAPERFVSPIPALFRYPLKGTGDSQVDLEHILILRARRLLTVEFLIMLAAGLVFMNSTKDTSRGRTHRLGSRRSVVRSASFVAAIFLLARLLTHLLLPYFQFLFEKQMLLYWLVALWLIVGGISNIVPAIVLSLSTVAARRPRKFTAVYLALIAAFMFGTLLIFRQLVHLKDTQTARNEIRMSGILPDGAGDSLESRLRR